MRQLFVGSLIGVLGLLASCGGGDNSSPPDNPDAAGVTGGSGGSSQEEGGVSGGGSGLGGAAGMPDAAPDATEDSASDAADSDAPDDAAGGSGGEPHEAGPDGSEDSSAGSGGDAGADAAAGAGGGDAGAGGQGGESCSTLCHGSADNPAPPKDMSGNVDSTFPGVGAHQSHLVDSDWHRDFACSDCHVVPLLPKKDPQFPTHINGKQDLVWSQIAGQGVFDATELTCSGSYCHGASLDPDPSVLRTPVWTKVDGSQKACAKACHSFPPGGSHPANPDCTQCHAQVISSLSPSIQWADPELHIDGKLDLNGLTCTTCHGTAPNAWPPTGTHGETSTGQPAVGAHAQHMTTSMWHRNIRCMDCHVLPVSLLHADGIVDYSWGGPSAADGAEPSYNASAVTCGDVYCHGTTLSGANAGGTVRREPLWTTVDGTFDGCGSSCHTNPPGDSHPDNIACPTCHGDVISGFAAGNPPTVTWADAAKHIDGKLDVKLSCTSCHGTAPDHPEPPSGTHGETSPIEPAVGAHSAHLAASDWHRDVQCSDCHASPSSLNHSDGIVNYSWGGPSGVDGASPAFDSLTVTCSSVYCHGSTLLGPLPAGTVQRQPVWTSIDGTYGRCGSSCHTNPPGDGHPTNPSCPTCHASIASFTPGDPPSVVWSDATMHIDGKVDVLGFTCTSCHGTAPNHPEPPSGTHGEISTQEPAVGAHTKHMAGGDWHRPVACSDCHVTPASMTHSDGTLDLSWGGPSAASGASPIYDPSSVVCNNTYCHGATLEGPVAGGSVQRNPLWTTVNGTYGLCGSTCHTNPPGGNHPKNSACPTCHPAVVSSFTAGNPPSVTWNDPLLHIDGELSVELSCTSCHGDAASGNAAPPLGTQGEVATISRAVGAHQNHLGPSSWHRTGVCADCHQTPGFDVHADGVVDFSWGAPSNADGATPSYDQPNVNCMNSYCHGTTLNPPKTGGTVSRTPHWTTVTGKYDRCGAACHTNPPGGDHPAGSGCPKCHASVISSYNVTDPSASVFANPELHINGTIEVGPLTCTSCHGDPATGSAAPPFGTADETSTATRAVGAHAQHLGPSTWHRPGQCIDCHIVPTSTLHENDVVALTWGNVSKARGTSPAFNTSTLTCSGVYCHGVALGGPIAGGTVNRIPTWTQVDGTFDACGKTCHTNPPIYHEGSFCPECHSDVISAFTPGNPPTVKWANPALHINGVVESTCSECH